jgi:hypothetical protein
LSGLHSISDRTVAVHKDLELRNRHLFFQIDIGQTCVSFAMRSMLAPMVRS